MIDDNNKKVRSVNISQQQWALLPDVLRAFCRPPYMLDDLCTASSWRNPAESHVLCIRVLVLQAHVTNFEKYYKRFDI